MSRSNPLSEREKAFEDVFFRKESERLLEAMRARKSREEQFEAISSVLGVDAPDLINLLLELGSFAKFHPFAVRLSLTTTQAVHLVQLLHFPDTFSTSCSSS